jgi:hypothetical protein
MGTRREDWIFVTCDECGFETRYEGSTDHYERSQMFVAVKIDAAGRKDNTYWMYLCRERCYARVLAALPELAARTLAEGAL